VFTDRPIDEYPPPAQMTTMTSPRFLLAACFGAALLTACPGDDSVLETEGTSTGTSTGDMPPTTLPMGTESSTSMGSVDTTVSPDDTSTTGDPDTTGSTDTGTTDTGSSGSSDSGSSGSSDSGSSDSGSSDSGSSESSSSGGEMNMEGYAECSVDVTQCLPQEVCVVDDPVMPTITVCTDLDCADASACPEAPAGGTAPVTCADITGDAINDCFLDCSLGQTCPTGMDCFANFLCAWPSVPPAPQGYAECAADPTVCLANEVCVFDNPGAPTVSVCADIDCVDASACPSSPPGGTAPVECTDVTGDAIGDCILDCSAGQTCPTGMSCFAGLLCVWPTVPPPTTGFGDCIGGDPCLPEEVCLVDNGMAPTIGVCTDLDCAVPADCPSPPAGGTAPVMCSDVSGDGIGDCFLDCSAGQACPTGMDCFAGFLCAWPA
jgi:hypothetical protein